MRQFLRNNGLAVVVVSTFLAIWLIGQTMSGWRSYNEQRRDDGESEFTFAGYLTTAHFGEATFENWESEFLQMGMYVLVTTRLRQRGSAESKPFDEPAEQDEDPELHRDDPGAPWPVRKGGAWLSLYKNSLGLAFIGLFFAAFILHAVTGSRLYNQDLSKAGRTDLVTTWSYLTRSRFWFESLQNWQSEFLAVAAIVLLSIVFRQYRSPESKPVHAAHATTGT